MHGYGKAAVAATATATLYCTVHPVPLLLQLACRTPGLLGLYPPGKRCSLPPRLVWLLAAPSQPGLSPRRPAPPATRPANRNVGGTAPRHKPGNQPTLSPPLIDHVVYTLLPPPPPPPSPPPARDQPCHHPAGKRSSGRLAQVTDFTGGNAQRCNAFAGTTLCPWINTAYVYPDIY